MEHDDPKLHANPILDTKKMVYKGNMGELINTVYIYSSDVKLEDLLLDLVQSFQAI